MGSENERREFTRVKYDVEATIEFAGELFESDLIDLSFRGALVSTGASPRKGQQVNLRFRLAQDGVPVNVRCSGRVVRADPRGVGIEFDEMDIESYQEIKAILAHNLGDSEQIEHEFERWLASHGQSETSS